MALALARNEPALYIPPRRMPHFHAVALFESRGSSFEDMDQTIASLLSSVSHRRLRYYEHETTEGPETPRRTPSILWSLLSSMSRRTPRKKPQNLVDEVLDDISTEEVQYFTHGLLPGKQRVRQARRASPQDDEQDNQQYDQQSDVDDQNDQDYRDQLADQDVDTDRRAGRVGRRRGTRGRSRGRQNDRETISTDASQEENSPEPESREAEAPRRETAEPVLAASLTTDIPDGPKCTRCIRSSG